MKKLVPLLLVIFAFSFAAQTASAQKPTRITFARGATKKIVTGRLTSYHSTRTFVIRVRKGQVLRTENVGDRDITIAIEAPRGSTYDQDMAADCHDKNEVDPTAGGDYIISVTECLKADAWRGTFKFKVSVH